MTHPGALDTRRTSPLATVWPLLRRALFSMDAERAHELIVMLSGIAAEAAHHTAPPAETRAQGLRTTLGRLSFENPIGLAAGLDKNGVALPLWQALGFGFVELGTVTAIPQAGNPRPRLFRMPKDGAIMNRMGFNNEGAAALARRVDRARRQGQVHVPVGINIGKSKVAPLADAPRDYLASFNTVHQVADYVVINVSSPNTPGLRDLQAEDALRGVLEAVANRAAQVSGPPVWLKIAPDLTAEAAAAAVQTAIDTGMGAVIATNTTISRNGLTGPIPDGSGGVSGKPLFARSTALLQELHGAFGTRIPFVGVGGIDSGDTARAKRDAGAALLQVYSGFIYRGPALIPEIAAALSA